MEPAHHRLCRAFAERTGYDRLERIPKRVSKALDRALRGGSIALSRSAIGGCNRRLFHPTRHPLHGATFLVLAPEHEGVSQWTTEECKEQVHAYGKEAARRSERERMSETKRVSGVFTGSYALHPLTQSPFPFGWPIMCWRATVRVR